jgi:hypothetical protein
MSFNIERIPDMTEREIDRQLCRPHPTEVYEALKKGKHVFVLNRARSNSLHTLLSASPLDQVRYSLALMTSALASLDWPYELNTQGSDVWKELQALEERLTKLNPPQA